MKACTMNFRSAMTRNRMKVKNLTMKFILLIALIAFQIKCSKSTAPPVPVPDPTPVANEVDFWLTKADQTVLLQKQTSVLAFATTYNVYPTIEIDDNQPFQKVEGFGFTLTGGSKSQKRSEHHRSELT